MKYKRKDEVPRPDEYCELRKLCGLSQMTLLAAQKALPNSLYVTTIRDGEKLIAMGRVIGDGGCHVQVVDIAVHPQYRKQGLSRLVMDSIVAFVNSQIPSCAVVNLFADIEYLYQKFGFYYPEKSKGMFMRRSK